MKTLQHFAVRCVVASVILGAVAASAYAQQPPTRSFEVSENGRVAATVNVTVTNELVKTVVSRRKQPAHIYRTAIWSGVTTMHVGDKKIIAYNNDAKRVELLSGEFSAVDVNAAARRKQSDIRALARDFAEDMRVLRAVRQHTSSDSVRLAELVFVITTGDYSIYEDAAPATLLVTETSQLANTARLTRTSVVQSLSGCKSDCATIRANCVAAVSPSDRVTCYTNENSCTVECHRIYKEGPATVEGGTE